MRPRCRILSNILRARCPNSFPLSELYSDLNSKSPCIEFENIGTRFTNPMTRLTGMAERAVLCSPFSGANFLLTGIYMDGPFCWQIRENEARFSPAPLRSSPITSDGIDHGHRVDPHTHLLALFDHSSWTVYFPTVFVFHAQISPISPFESSYQP
jgi:hypothetical protein